MSAAASALNLCEALLLHRRLEETRQSDREAVRLAQLGLAMWGDESPSELTRADVGAATTTAATASDPPAAVAALAAAAAAAVGATSRHAVASTPRLLSARWLLPAPATPSDTAASNTAATSAASVSSAEVDASPTAVRQLAAAGCLAYGPLLMLGWLWTAVSEEGLGLASAALRSYKHALLVSCCPRVASACR